LASGSADNTIRLWDLDTQQTLAILRHHGSKVQCVRWHPIEASLLASASYDRRVCVLDVRNPNEVRSFTLPEDPESMLWHPQSPAHLLVRASTPPLRLAHVANDSFAPRQVSTESGRVICFDATKPDDQPVMVLDAHAKAISSMDLNPNVPGLLITVSVDKTFKIWDLTPTTPVLLHSETVAVRFDLALSRQTRCSLTWRAAGFRSNCSRSRGIPTFRSCSPSVARARSRPCQHSSSTACTESSTQRRLPKSLLNELTPPPYPHVVICRVYPRIASKSILLLHLSALTSSSFVVVDAILRPRSINQPINQSVNQSINQPL